jgi:hypothetical protein
MRLCATPIRPINTFSLCELDRDEQSTGFPIPCNFLACGILQMAAARVKSRKRCIGFGVDQPATLEVVVVNRKSKEARTMPKHLYIKALACLCPSVQRMH